MCLIFIQNVDIQIYGQALLIGKIMEAIKNGSTITNYEFREMTQKIF